MVKDIVKFFAAWAMPAAFAGAAYRLGSAYGLPWLVVALLAVAVFVLLSVLGSSHAAQHFRDEERGGMPSIDPAGDGVKVLAKLCSLYLMMSLAGGLGFYAAWLQRPEGLPQFVRVFLPYMVAALGVAGTHWVMVTHVLFRPREIQRRGAELVPEEECSRKAAELVPEGDPGVAFAGDLLPTKNSVRGYLFVSGIGGGKTTLLRLMMQSVIPKLERGSRAVVWDVKHEMLPILYGMKAEWPVFTMDPFDMRCVAWDIARDITTRAAAAEFARLLIPDKKSSQPFFDNAARALLMAVVVTFMESKKARYEWTLADVMYVLSDDDRLAKFLNRTEWGRARVKRYLSKKSTALDVMSTLQNSIEEFEVIAAMWSRAKQKLSLREFVKGEAILVLADSHTARGSLQALNRVIFQRLTQLLLDEKDSSSRRTWFFIDEAAKAAGDMPLPMLDELILKGRSKGVSPCLAFQSVDDWLATYGKERGQAMLDQLAHKAVMRSEGETAIWASKQFGEYEKVVYRPSDTTQQQGLPEALALGSKSRTVAESLEIRPVVMAEQIVNLPTTNIDNGLHVYARVPDIGATYRVLPGHELFTQWLKPLDKSVEAQVKRPDSHQRLRPWTEKDCLRLGLNPNILVSDEEKEESDKPEEESANGQGGMQETPRVDLGDGWEPADGPRGTIIYPDRMPLGDRDPNPDEIAEVLQILEQQKRLRRRTYH